MASASRSHAAVASAVDPAFGDAGRTIQDGINTSDAKARSQTVEAIAARIPNLRNPNNPNALTPLRAHYLKKTLVRLQVDKEVEALAKKDALSTFGPPFRPSPAARNTDLPLARFVFHHFVLTFPFLRSAPQNFFADKVQVFIDRFLERNISGTDDRSEETKRKKMSGKLEKMVTLLIASAITIGGEVGGEEVVRISDADGAKMAAVQEQVKAALAGAPVQHGDAIFEVNVIGIRTQQAKGRIRSRVHEQFIIRTRRPGSPDVFVSRRYGDFQRLADTLRVEYPDEDINRPPPKDRSNTEVNSPYMASATDGDASDSASASTPAFSHPSSSSNDSPRTSYSSNRQAMTTGPLAREKNRLTLRAYLRTLLAIPAVADSPALADFLLGEPTQLTAAEEADARQREALDAVRTDEAMRFNQEAASRVAQLKEHLAEFKADLVQRDGLSRVFSTIKATPRIEDLPESYQALLGWARISAASTLFHLFMGSDTSSDLFSQMKRIHGLMPYFMMRQVLRVSNPVTMIRGVIDLFLAQPFGQRSLLQRMFSSSLQEEAKELQEMIVAVQAKVEDDVLCEKVQLFVEAPLEVQNMYKRDAESEKVDILTTILRAPEEPRLNRSQIHRVVRASRAFEVYRAQKAALKNPEDDEGPQDDDAWLYEDLHVLLRLMTRLRDKEQMLSLIFEGVTSELLKDIVTIFYSPLAQVYKAANIADSLYDLQNFINDLIKTVEANEELSYTDPQRTVQVFIDLVARHEARFYNFVHQVHSKGAGLFDGLMHWIELFLNFVRSGDPTDSSSHQNSSSRTPTSSQGQQQQPQSKGLGAIDLEICMPAGGTDRAVALAEIDALVVYAYQIKMLRELKLRRRLAEREVKGAGDKVTLGLGFAGPGDEDEEHAFLDAVADNLGVGGAFTSELEDADAEEEYEEDEENETEDQQGGNSAARRSDAEDLLSDSETDTETDTDSEPEAVIVDAKKPTAPSLRSQSSWRPPPPGRQDSLLTIGSGGLTPRVEKELPSLPVEEPGQANTANKRRRRPLKPKAPELKVIPEMVPLFVEILRPMLRPSRGNATTSSSSNKSVDVSGLSLSDSGNREPARRDSSSAGAGAGGAAPPGGWGFW
ncbi:unnamed protein product [Sympodiomycopsis kandeliae]